MESFFENGWTENRKIGIIWFSQKDNHNHNPCYWRILLVHLLGLFIIIHVYYCRLCGQGNSWSSHVIPKKIEESQNPPKIVMNLQFLVWMQALIAIYCWIFPTAALDICRVEDLETSRKLPEAFWGHPRSCARQRLSAGAGMLWGAPHRRRWAPVGQVDS